MANIGVTEAQGWKWLTFLTLLFFPVTLQTIEPDAMTSMSLTLRLLICIGTGVAASGTAITLLQSWRAGSGQVKKAQDARARTPRSPVRPSARFFGLFDAFVHRQRILAYAPLT